MNNDYDDNNNNINNINNVNNFGELLVLDKCDRWDNLLRFQEYTFVHIVGKK